MGDWRYIGVTVRRDSKHHNLGDIQKAAEELGFRVQSVESVGRQIEDAPEGITRKDWEVVLVAEVPEAMEVTASTLGGNA